MMLWAAEDSPNPLVPAWQEIVVGLVGFAVVLFVLIKFVWPAFERSYQARREAIEGGIERAEKAQAEARAALEKYNEQLAGARTEAAKIRDDARGEGQRIIEEMRRNAQEESARIVARGEEQLAAQRQQVVNELRTQVGTLSVDLASRLVGQRLEDDTNVRSTVDSFLDDLDEMAGSTPERR